VDGVKEAVEAASEAKKMEQLARVAQEAQPGMELVQVGALICRLGGSLLITVLEVDEEAHRLRVQVSNLGVYASKQLVHNLLIRWRGSPRSVLEVKAKQLTVRELTPDDIQQHKSAQRSMRRAKMDEEGGRLA